MRIAQRLDHPNIIKYLCCEFDQVSGTLHVLLELASNGDLSHFIADHIKNTRLIPESTIWKFIIQLSSAIDFMHANRIIHRDLKPANILLSKDGDIKICDFGLGKCFVEGDRLYSTSALGSPYYMSPERLLREKYYFNSDIWSLGCIIYELAALQSPFYVSKLDMNLLIKRVISRDFAPVPSDLYSKELHAVIETCLTVDCKKRPSAHHILGYANDFCAQHY
ncbi:serine/threonine-protein kinase Nek7-like isoform X2 [Planococcus citri]|uniref:serine/threonine-protein kinase Nek7-like isoform X2 n=1 Tax=Planococcus citri TaxID=170843 RepID=UPI0031F85C9B